MLSELWHKLKVKWWVWAIVFFFLLVSLLVSFHHGGKVMSTFNDFKHFYLSGWHFAHGDPLYGKLSPRLELFLYPPFAAWLFHFMVYMSPEAAASLHSLFNLLLFPLIIFFLLKLLKSFGIEHKQVWLALVFSLLFSIRYFFSNFNMFQINEITLVLVLWGLLSYKNDKAVWATVFFSIAACIKIIPAIFLLWLFFRVPRVRIVLVSLATALLLFAIPFPFRGFQQSLIDLQDFYSQVLQPYLFSQEVIHHYHNQSLPAAIGRLLMPSNNESTFTYNVLNLPYHQVARIVSVANVVLALSFLAALFYRVRKKISFGLEEIALVFLFSHLYSSLTWKNHLVSMIVVFVPLFMIPFRSQTKMMKAVLLFLYTLLVILSLNISFLIPDEVRFLIGGFSLYTLMMVILYVVLVVRSFRALPEE